MHASQCLRLRLSTGSPHIAHTAGFAGRASTVGVRHARVAYGRGCEALRGVASSGDRADPGTLRRLFLLLAARMRGDTPLLTSDSRKIWALQEKFFASGIFTLDDRVGFSLDGRPEVALPAKGVEPVSVTAYFPHLTPGRHYIAIRVFQGFRDQGVPQGTVCL